MRDEDKKGEIERGIFSTFARISTLPIDPATIKKCRPPEPDILCTILDEGPVAFELAELCSSDIAKTMSKVSKEGGEEFLWTSDPSRAIIFNKLTRHYETPHPIELLCYLDGRAIDPANIILPRILPIFDSRKGSKGPFRRAWLLDETDEVHLIWMKSGAL